MMSDEPLLARFGTEFEELENEDQGISKKPLAVENQIVTDEKGRRRFHGAFTGGFSAGYFNTVGSKEGWTPSTFKSSRTERADENLSRPEDFMDEHDLGEYGITPRQVRSTKDFADRTAALPEKRLAWERSAHGLAEESAKLAELVKPVADSFGVELLKKMGWRPGQGIGPRVSKRKLEHQRASEKKTYGCELPPGVLSEIEELEEMAPDFLFAPDDVDPSWFEAKTNLHGLGYKGLAPTPYEGVPKQDVIRSDKKNARGISGQAFGVGAFENDDEDIYGSTDLSRYDFALGSRSAAFDDKFSEISDDFEAAKLQQSTRKFYPPPKLSRSYVPVHRPEPLAADLPASLKGLGVKLNPVQRAHILGEKHSILPLLNQEAREKVQAARRGAEKEHQSDKTTVAFPNDLRRQKRFMEYVSYLKRGLQYPQPPELTAWEWEQEIESYRKHVPPEYLHSMPDTNNSSHSRARPLAKPEIARPFAHLLKSKFTSAKYEEDEAKQAIEDEDKVQAVKMNMFGRLTREQLDWHPDRQLCKRFNLPNPYPDSRVVGVPHLKKETSKEVFMLGVEMLPSTAQELANRHAEHHEASHLHKPIRFETLAEESAALLETAADTSSTSQKQTDTSDIFVEKPVPDDQESSRPPMDLFRAIFASSDEESNDDEDDDNERVTQLLPSATEKTASTRHKDQESTRQIQLTHMSTERSSEASDGFPSFSGRSMDVPPSSPPPKFGTSEKVYGPAVPPEAEVVDLSSGDDAVPSTRKRRRHHHRSKRKREKTKSKVNREITASICTVNRKRKEGTRRSVLIESENEADRRLQILLPEGKAEARIPTLLVDNRFLPVWLSIFYF